MDGSHRPWSRPLVGLGGLVVVAVTLAGAAALREDRAPAADAHHGQPVLPRGEFPEPGLLHVHGLGVAPSDGTLYAATHTGLFRLPERGQAVRVANRYQDTMGFTVSQDGSFLASGHPDLREDLPGRLGLIRSSDGGVTWQPMSLVGEADFHALASAPGRVYGYDAHTGTLRVTTDLRSWETLSRLDVRSLAVNPSNPSVLVASTPAGVVRSEDGGRRWAPLEGAPTLAYLGWAPSGELHGVTGSGVVFSATGDLRRWVERAGVGGAPEAFHVSVRDGVQTLYVAVAERGIVMSTDGGRRFA
jgi:hypothetical protein